jgi:hypothetical protein
MEKQARVQLNLRVSPLDAEKLATRAREESRTLGEVFALILKENELLSREEGAEQK